MREDLTKRYGRDDDYRKWGRQMPAFPFKPHWTVTVIPPFGGAAVRFRVNGISVYCDFDGSLGAMDVPYWEIYPAANGDVERFYLNETQECADAIETAIQAGMGDE